MRKKFYLIATLALLSWNVGNAQVSSSPRPSLLGLKAKAISKKPETAKTETQQSKAITRMVSANAVPTLATQANDETQVTKLTGWTSEVVGGAKNENTITYDEQGRIKTITNSEYKEVISYVDGTHGQWVEMTVSRVVGGVSTVWDKNVRTQDSQGRIITEKIYHYDEYEKELYLTNSYAYDYEHGEGAKVIEDLRYEDGSSYGVGEKYVWFEPTQQYIVNHYYYHSRETTTINGNSYTTIQEQQNSDGNWVKDGFAQTYFYNDKGEQTGSINYDYTEGILQSAYGQKQETLLNTPEAGYITKMTYTYTCEEDDNSDVGTSTGSKSIATQANLSDYFWRPSYKIVSTSNYDEPCIPDGKKRSCIEYSYDVDSQTWEEKSSDISEWVSSNILKTKSFYHNGDYLEEELYYEYYDNQGNEVGEAFLFGDGSYVVESEEEDTDGIYIGIYTYYDKAGNVLKKYKQVHKDSYHSTENTTTFYVWNGSQWVIFSGTIKFGDGANKMTAIIDSKGRPTENATYDENGELYKKYVYTYTNNGYTETYYRQKEDKSGLCLRWVDTYSIDASGTYENIEKEYDEEGSVIYAYKYKEYKNGIKEYYSWNGSDFALAYTDVEPIRTEENGVTTEIYRKVVNGEVVETSKTITTKVGNEVTEERYSKQDGKWVGESKTVDSGEFAAPKFEYTLPNPRQEYDVLYNSYYSNIQQGSTEEVERTYRNYIIYSWGDNNDWVITGKDYTTCVIDGNTMTRTTDYGRDGYYYKETIILKRDAQKHLTEETYESSETDPTDVTNINTSTRTNLYTYDSEGNLLTDTYFYNGNKSTVTTYTYGKITVTEIENIAKDDKAQLLVIGNTITVSGCNNLTLYSLNGTLVGKSSNGSITAPTKGLYILEAGKKKVKLLVK